MSERFKQMNTLEKDKYPDDDLIIIRLLKQQRQQAQQQKRKEPNFGHPHPN